MNELEGSRMFMNISRLSTRDHLLPGRFWMDYVWMTRPVQIWQPVQIWHDSSSGGVSSAPEKGIVLPELSCRASVKADPYLRIRTKFVRHPKRCPRNYPSYLRLVSALLWMLGNKSSRGQWLSFHKLTASTIANMTSVEMIFALRHPKSAKICKKCRLRRWHVTPLTNLQIISSKCC